MNLLETILAAHSKEQTNKIIKWIGKDQKRFDLLFELFINAESLVQQRAGWPLSYIAMGYPELIQKHLNRLLKNLKKQGLHNAIKRNSIRLLQDIPIPERFHGDVMNICFGYITDIDEKAAIKAFSLTVLENLANQYPDIKNELKLVIESQWEHEGAAFRSRAKGILSRL